MHISNKLKIIKATYFVKLKPNATDDGFFGAALTTEVIIRFFTKYSMFRF